LIFYNEKNYKIGQLWIYYFIQEKEQINIIFLS
jgi:hypothetical protein